MKTRVEVSATIDTAVVTYISGRPVARLETKAVAAFEELDDQLWSCIHTLWHTTPGIKSVHIALVEGPDA